MRLLTANQILACYTRAPVTVRGTGLLDLNGHQDSLAEIFLEGGRIDLGAGGGLTLCSNVTASGGAQISGSPGLVDLGGAARAFTVADTVAGDDFRISASVGGTGSLTKQGAGQMLLSGSNWYSGLTFVAEGLLAVSHDYALGGGAATMVRSNATLELRSSPFSLFHLRELLWLNGGWLRTRNLVSGATALITCEEPVELLADSVIFTASETSLTLKGALTGAGGFRKTGPGELALQSTAANTYQGDTVVEQGVLRLGCATLYGAISGPSLIIGDGVGGRGADVVQFERHAQIALTTEVQVRSSGLLDLNGYDQILGARLDLLGGEVRTGSGKLYLGTGASVRAESQTAPGALISGNLNLLGVATWFDMRPGLISPALQVYATVSGESGRDFVVTGPGGLALWASNSFQGRLVVAEGSVLVAHDHALGSTAGGTVVSNGASLILASVAIPAELLSVRGAGCSSYGALWSGNGQQASWLGPITLTADTVIGVVGTNGQLTLSGPITGPGGLTKLGEGTLIFTGDATNDYAGNTWVREGTLRLAKEPGMRAIRRGTLIIGDGEGGRWADRVIWDNDEQIAELEWVGFSSYYWTDVPVVVESSGWMRLNGYTDAVKGLTLHAGWVETLWGTLYLNGDVRADSTPTNMAIIEGRVDLGIEPICDPNWLWERLIEVSGTNSLLGLRADLVGCGGVRKTGSGELSLSGANSYLGTTIISEGVLSITRGQALGYSWRGTVVEPGASLALDGFGVSVTNEALTLAGEGFQGRGALYTEGFLGTLSNAWTGPITLSNDTRIAVAADTILNLACPIDGPGGFTKTGAGRLLLSGTNANTYAGTTRVQEGLLELAKGIGALNGAIPGRLEIGSATVRLLGSTQIANTSDVDLASSGVLDLNNKGEAFDELSGAGTVQLGSGYLNVGTDNGSSTFAGRITGTGDLTKFGTGTLWLTGNNPYTGVTTVREGTLVVNGDQGGSAVTVQAGATLRGIGQVGPLTVYGRVVPGGAGAVPGTLLCGNVTFASSAQLTCTLFDEGSDRLQVQGTVQLGNATLELASQTSPWLGRRFWLIDNDGTDAVVGTFAGLPEGATVTVNGVPLQLSYRGGSSNDVVLTFAQAAVEVAGVWVRWGNGNGVLDPGDCSLLDVLLTNRAGATVQQIQASLLPGSPGSGGAPLDGLWLPR